MKTVLLRVTSSNSDYNADCALALVQIDKELAKKILERRKLFLQERGNDVELVEKYYWSGSAHFYENGGKVDELYDEHLTDDDLVELDEDPVKRTEEMRTECDQMIIREDGVAWTMIPKHSDIYITTSIIPYAMVEAYL
jgi:hypothetical protein